MSTLKEELLVVALIVFYAYAVQNLIMLLILLKSIKMMASFGILMFVI